MLVIILIYLYVLCHANIFSGPHMPPLCKILEAPLALALHIFVSNVCTGFKYFCPLVGSGARGKNSTWYSDIHQLYYDLCFWPPVVEVWYMVHSSYKEGKYLSLGCSTFSQALGENIEENRFWNCYCFQCCYYNFQKHSLKEIQQKSFEWVNQVMSVSTGSCSCLGLCAAVLSV